MIKELYKLGYFDYKSFIIDNSVKLGVSPLEALILVKLLDNYKIKDDYDVAVLESICHNHDDLYEVLPLLVERSFFEVYLETKDGLSHEKVAFDGLFNKIEMLLEDKPVYSDDLRDVIKECQVGLAKILTSNELDIITSLYKDDKYTLLEFKKALEIMKKKKRALNVKTLAQILSSERNEKKTETPDFVKKFLDDIK